MTATNGESVKLDNKSRVMGDKLTPVDDSGAKTMLPTNSDWVEFPAASTAFTYSSATRITITGITPSDRFQVGDKVRIKQTSYKYFYVISVGATYIDVHAGTDYTVANATISEFAISRIVNPTGFPGAFTYTPGVDSTNNRASLNTGTLDYFMVGNAIFISGSLSIDLSASENVVWVDFPFALRSTSNFGKPTIYVDNGASLTARVGHISYGPAIESGDSFYVLRTDGADWTGAGFTVDPFFSYIY